MDRSTVAGFGAVLTWLGQLITELATDEPPEMAGMPQPAPPRLSPDDVKQKVTDVMTAFTQAGLVKEEKPDA